jgi:hypothetical protein
VVYEADVRATEDEAGRRPNRPLAPFFAHRSTRIQRESPVTMSELILIRSRGKRKPREQVFFNLARLIYAKWGSGGLTLHTEIAAIEVADEDVDRVLEELERIGGANTKETSLPPLMSGDLPASSESSAAARSSPRRRSPTSAVPRLRRR